jgi:hypothetical protein
MVVVAVIVHAALAAGGLAAFVALGGHRSGLALPFPTTLSVVHGQQIIAPSFAQRVALGFGVENLACGLLVLLPLPPLELGVALWTVLPRSAGTRKWAYRFLEEQWGIAIVLLLMVIPLGGTPLLLRLVVSLSDQILTAIGGG